MQWLGVLGCDNILATGNLGSTALRTWSSFDNIENSLIIYPLWLVLVEWKSRQWPRTRTHVYLATNIPLPPNFSTVLQGGRVMTEVQVYLKVNVAIIYAGESYFTLLLGIPAARMVQGSIIWTCAKSKFSTTLLQYCLLLVPASEKSKRSIYSSDSPIYQGGRRESVGNRIHSYLYLAYFSLMNIMLLMQMMCKASCKFG